MTLTIHKRFFGISRKRCDNCGKFNPKRLGGNDRLCGEVGCATPEGMYSMPGESLRALGKVGYWYLQIPIRIDISWTGWWHR